MASTTDESEISEMESEEETQESESTSSVSLVTKVNVKAAVWRYFGMETDEHGVVKDVDLPVCKIDGCLTRVKTKHSNTSNLYSHLKKHHPTEYEAVRPKSKGKVKPKGTIEEAFKLSTKLSPNSQEHKKLTRAITYYILYCICATSVPAERVFSVGGNVVSDSRNCLKPQSVDQLIFLATNL